MFFKAHKKCSFFDLPTLDLEQGSANESTHFNWVVNGKIQSIPVSEK